MKNKTAKETKAVITIKILGDMGVSDIAFMLSFANGIKEPRIVDNPTAIPIVDTRQVFDTCGIITAGIVEQTMLVSIANKK